jgi:aquaporin Z
MDVFRKLLAELIGTFFLVFVGCGASILSGYYITREVKDPINIGVSMAGVALAFGFAYAATGYAFGHVSGGHFNPAVSIGALIGRRLSPLLLLPYVIVQVLGAAGAIAALYFIALGNGTSPLTSTTNPLLAGFGANGFGDHSPAMPGYKYDQQTALLTETLLTFFFVSAVLGGGDRRVPRGFMPLAGGLALTAVYLVGFPVTGVSVNPAKSTAPALLLYLFGGEKWAVEQLWVFWAAPALGGALAGAVYGILRSDERAADVEPVTRERSAYGTR